MYKFTIHANDYLRQDIQAFCHTQYTGMGNPGNPDYLNHLKNTFNDFSRDKLQSAVDELWKVLLEDLPKIPSLLELPYLTACVVPRAKAENTYEITQLLFKSTVLAAINELEFFNDGTEYIKRHTDTKTTHLSHTQYGGNGDMPYPRITNNTCRITNDVKGRNILLIDDLYTYGVNVDEDIIQTLLDKGV